MMHEFLKTYRLTFKTKAPVHIGNGRMISKKEYLFDQMEGRIEYIDIDKMYHGLRQMHLDRQYEDYLLRDNGRSLLDFFRMNKISRQIYQPWIRYSEVVGDPMLNYHSVENVNEFVKGPDGLPYIPGSSIKGAFRTMLEVSEILRRPKAYSSIGSRIEREEFQKRSNYLLNLQKEVDENAFHRELFHDKYGRYDATSLVNDVMRGIYFTDSEPLSYDDLCLCQKIDLSTDGTYNKLNLVRECIKPNTTIQMKVTVDTGICPYSNQDILRAVADYYVNCTKEFISKFHDAPIIGGTSTNFFLGAGAGFVSKTVLYAMLHGSEGRHAAATVMNNTLPNQLKRRHGHDQDESKGASPHMLKCTQYQGRKYQMGACCILKLIPMESS